MKCKLDTLTFALTCVLGFVSLPATSVHAQDEAADQSMTGDEIQETARGNTTIGVFAERPIRFEVYLTPDGEMIGRITDAEGDRIERGDWRVENDRLLGRWDNIRGGEWQAFEYRRVGQNIHAYREDGTLDRIQYYVEGDPLGLGDEHDQAEPLVPSDNGATPNFEQVIRDLYFAQWRDTAEHPFSMEVARGLYLTDDRLTALDTDALAVEGADSRLEGWEEYAPVWPAAFEQIKHFEAGEIHDLLVRRHGDWALVTFDMSGDVELENGDKANVFKHFTLIWLDTGDGWRIFHEHISDGQPAEKDGSEPQK